jgi:pre-mRNA processing factor 3 (PRP3).
LAEIREKIKLGIIEAPPQKVKLATFMKVMSKELAQDPSKTEQEIMKNTMKGFKTTSKEMKSLN